MHRYYPPKSFLSLAILAVSCTALLLSAAVDRADAAGRVRTEVVAIAGDVAPDGRGSYFRFGAPALNDAGEASFISILTDGSSGVFRGDATSHPVQIARNGDVTPDGSDSIGSFIDFFSAAPALNDAGQAAFRAQLSGPSGGNGDGLGIFRGDGTSSLMQTVRTNDIAPNGNGSFSSLGHPTLNEAGQVAFNGTLTGTDGGNSDNRGIFRADPGSPGLMQIAREGDVAPDGNGSFSSFYLSALNDAGQTAFVSLLSGTSGGTSDRFGIFRDDPGAASLAQVARAGDTVPDGNGVFFGFDHPAALNEVGQTAFTARLIGTDHGTRDETGIFRGDADGSLVQIVRRGEFTSDRRGRLGFFQETPALNDSGQVAFRAGLVDSSRPAHHSFSFIDYSGVFLGDGATSPVQIVRDGDAAPDGNGRFKFGGDTGIPVLNNAGDVAFSGFLIGTSENGGLFAYNDRRGLTQVMRAGDALLGSTIAGHLFSVGSDEQSGLNELGQLAYQFRLADGRQGIAIATLVPEPGGLLLGVLAGGVGLWRQRGQLLRPARL